MQAIKKRFDKKWRKNKKTGCWEWIGSKFPSGYGMFWFKYKNQKINRAHRVSYLLNCGHLPKGKYICHTCDNPGCVNPDHLWAGTAKDNRVDCVNKKRNNSAKGSKLPQSKLNEKQADFIKTCLQLKVFTHQQIADVFNVTRRTITAISKGDNWKCAIAK